MGACCCCGTSDDEYKPVNQPDAETRRRQMADAAERRQREQEGRGVKDPEAVKRKQQRNEEMERRVESVGVSKDGPLRWNVG